MIIYTRGIAIIQHCVSKEEFEIHNDELDWEVVAENEQSMGQETIYEAFLDHEDLGDLRWSISEYPVGVENSTNAIVGSHIIVSDFKYGLEHEPELDEELPINLPNKLNDNSQWAAALTRGSLVKHLTEWFHHYYEDPAMETQWISREGGYQYIKGGPYYAEEELRDNFEGIIPEGALMAAVENIEKEVLEWAPSSNHPDHEMFYEDSLADEVSFEGLSKIAASTPSIGIGSVKEKIARAAIRNQISELKDALPKPTSHVGIGHNRPPDEFELINKTLESIDATLESIDAELASNDPSVEVVAKKAVPLANVISFLASKINLTVDEFLKSYGNNIGKAAAIGSVVKVASGGIFSNNFLERLAALFSSLENWLLRALGM